MALGEDQMVVVGIGRVVELVVQVLSQQDRHEISRRHGRCRMPGTSGGAAADAVHSKLLGQLVPLLGLRIDRCRNTHLEKPPMLIPNSSRQSPSPAASGEGDVRPLAVVGVPPMPPLLWP